ncbi:MAG: hypothetical protein AB1589_42820 [Cyanobacteriota bacterium]
MQALQRVLITCALIFGGVTIVAIAKGAPIQVALTTGTTTLAMAAGTGAVKP